LAEIQDMQLHVLGKMRFR